MLQKNILLLLSLLIPGAIWCMEDKEQVNSKQFAQQCEAPTSKLEETKTLKLLCADDLEIEIPFITASKSTVLKDLLADVDPTLTQEAIPVQFSHHLITFLKQKSFTLDRAILNDFVKGVSPEELDQKLDELDRASDFFNIPFSKPEKLIDRLITVGALKIIDEHPGHIQTFQSLGGLYCAYANELRIFNKDNIRFMPIVTMGKGTLRSVVTSPNSKHVFIINNDKEFYIYDISKGKIVNWNNNNDDPFWSVLVIANNRIIIAGRRSLVLWKTENDWCTMLWDYGVVTSNKQISCTLSYKTEIITADFDGNIARWSIKDPNDLVCTYEFKAHEAYIEHMLIEGDSLFTATDKELKVWDMTRGTCVETLPVRDIVDLLVHKGKLIVANKYKIRIYDLQTFNEEDSVLGYYLQCCDKAILNFISVSSSNDLIIISYRVTNCKCIKNLNHQRYYVASMDLDHRFKLKRLLYDYLKPSETYLFNKLYYAVRCTSVTLNESEKTILERFLNTVSEDCDDVIKQDVEKELKRMQQYH